MTAIHVVVPDSVDDPAQPSGGNNYDRHVCRGLASLGWSVHEHRVAGRWPQPDEGALAGLAAVVRQLPDDAVVLLDGLIASTAPRLLVPEGRRLRLVVLIHMPLGHRPTDENGTRDVAERERAVLSTAAAIVTTSAWSRGRLLELYPLLGDRVRVAEPGVDAADLVAGTAGGRALLCVAALTPGKGHDLLLDALETALDLPWQCVCAGSLDRDPAFVAALRRHALDHGLDERVHFVGPRTGSELDRSYAGADVLLLASRAETYGMVVTEALARGLPVIATEVGGVAEALGHGADGRPPGLLVPPEDSAAFGAALRAWLSDSELRKRLRRGAGERRETLSEWSSTASAVADVLARVAQ